MWLEIKQQRKEKISEIIKKLEDIKKSFSIEGVNIEINKINYDKNSDNLLDSVFQNYINRNMITNAMPIVINKDSIVSRVINKKPPFEGKAKESDKGFKDALLWESIIYYKNTNLNRKIVLYTNDKIFNDKCLSEEYYREFNEEIKIIGKEEEVIDLIKQLSVTSSKEINSDNSIYKRINDFILSNREVQKQYKYWIEEGNAYGDGIKVVAIENLEILNIIKKIQMYFLRTLTIMY